MLYYKCEHPAQFRTLLHLRKEMLDLWAHYNQNLLYDAIKAFNDSLTEALAKLYKQAHETYGNIKYAPNAELTARCFLTLEKPKAFNDLGLFRKEVWYALSDAENYNPLYQHGVSFYELSLPQDLDVSFDHFIGIYEKTDWIPDFLSELREKGLFVNSGFYNLATASYFAVTDFICVRKFETNIDIHIEQK